jgi:hypothetical protein
MVKYFDLFGLENTCGCRFLQGLKPEIMEDEQCARPSADSWVDWVDLGSNWVDIGGRGGVGRRYGPGASLTEWTGRISDTVKDGKHEFRKSACHGKRAV